MGRLPRRLFTLAATALGVLCAATAAVWPSGLVGYYQVGETREPSYPWNDWVVHHSVLEYHDVTIRMNGDDTGTIIWTPRFVLPVWPAFFDTAILPSLWAWNAVQSGFV